MNHLLYLTKDGMNLKPIVNTAERKTKVKVEDHGRAKER